MNSVGLLLYENGEYEDAIQYLQQIVMSSKDAGYKATALNLLGCICAKLVNLPKHTFSP
jgi:Tfp pilus assembly protein PilF